MKRSVWLGALVGPLVASVGYLAVMMLLPDSTPKDERSVEAAFVALVAFLLPVSYLASFIFGMPLVYILRRYQKLSFWPVVLLAAPLGTLAAVCVLSVSVAFFDATVQWGMIDLVDALVFLGGSAAYGSVIGGVFCLLTGITKNSTRAATASRSVS